MRILAVIIPAYNEEKNIEEVIKRTEKTVDAEIIVVDDFSKDKTALIAKKAGAHVIRHQSNKGKGGALKTGLEEILKKYHKIKYIILIDADLQYDPEDMPKFLSALNKGADYVTGFRNWWRDVPIRHRIGNFFWRKAFNTLFGTELLDSNCGYMGMNRKSLKILSKCNLGGYIVDNVLLAKAVEAGLKIKQVPVRVHYTKKRNLRTGIRFFFGNFLYIIEEGFKYRYGFELKIYRRLVSTRLLFSKGG